MGTGKRTGSFPIYTHPFLEMEEWWQGWEARTSNPCSEDVGWDTPGRAGPAWINDAHGSQRQGVLPTAVEKEEGFSALELHTAWSFLCAARKGSLCASLSLLWPVRDNHHGLVSPQNSGSPLGK